MASTGSTQHLVIRKKDSVVMTDTDKPSMSVKFNKCSYRS